MYPTSTAYQQAAQAGGSVWSGGGLGSVPPISPERTIPAHLSRLDKALEQLQAIVSALEQRLVSVLEPVPVNEAKLGGTAGTAPAGVAGRIADSVVAVEIATSRLTGLIERLHV